ncbi:MAG: hypothetical protein ACYDBL_01340 [Candidatus Acidiferrales bacterium]
MAESEVAAHCNCKIARVAMDRAFPAADCGREPPTGVEPCLFFAEVESGLNLGTSLNPTQRRKHMSTAAAKLDSSKDEANIRALIESLHKAHHDKDAAAIASHCTRKTQPYSIERVR